ncbi:MAG: entericidin [Bacteroidaceae bacterium]|nr:entericidin [Bacteroidaceae bacterium]
MKKVAFMFVAALAISFASCGGQTKASEEACDSTACDSAVVEEVVDSAVVDSAAAEVEAPVAE